VLLDKSLEFDWREQGSEKALKFLKDAETAFTVTQRQTFVK